MNDIWQEFLKIVREEVGSRVVETWFKAVQMVRWDTQKKVVYLQAPNQFVREWLSSNYTRLFQQHLSRLLSEQTITIKFVDDPTHSLLPVLQTTLVLQKIEKPVQRYEPATSTNNKRQRGPINQSYLFDTFVVGPTNKLAFAAARAVAENPGRLYNPLFIYGGSGLGKTHLLHAIGNHIKEQNKKSQILYQSADRFVNEFINAIRFNKVYQFEMRYKDVDVLLVDDIQFISNKEQTQEAFFHIFNTLQQSYKQIVFTSDSMPGDIAGLAERMRSRLEGGLVADIQLPALETKIAIVQKKAELNSELLTDDVAHFIASREYSNIRELEGAFIRVVAFAALTKQPLTLELAQKVLMRTYKETKQQKSIDLQRIVQCVAQHFDYTLQEIRSSKRSKDLTHARHVALYLMKKLTDRSFKEIGVYLERKDHSTVIHAFEKIKHNQKNDSSLCEVLQRLEHEISA